MLSGLFHQPDRHALNPNFRRDVQGLRGVAVALVVLYHVEAPLKGGFVGVDCFFVISGFVITRMILDEHSRQEGFSFVRFYSRRVSRIVPLFAVVTLTTILFSHFRLSPFGEIQDVVSTGQWSIAFLANHELLSSNSYVGLVSNPLRHLWSLSVEEQFYLVYPLLAALHIRRRQKGVRAEDRANYAFLALAVGSFLLCVYLSHFASPFAQRASFFMALPRAWQFLAGVAVALVINRRNNSTNVSRALLAAASTAGLMWSAWAFTEIPSYPGIWAVLPTVSTVGILISSAPGSLINRFLSQRLLVLLGEYSYGLYLWHWPIVVFVSRQHSLTTAIAAVIVLLSLLLTAITYALVEEPLRTNFRSPQKALVLGAVSVLVIATGNFLVKRSSDQVYARALSPVVPSDAQMVRFGLGVRDTRLNLVDQCSDPSTSLAVIEQLCSNSEDSGVHRVLLLGDSHAAALGDGLFLAGEKTDTMVAGFFEYGCPIIDGYTVQRIEDCIASIGRSLELVDQFQPDLVVLAASYSAYVAFEQEATTVMNSDPRVAVPTVTRERIKKLIGDALVRIRQITSRGVTVVVVKEVPFAIMPGTKTQDEHLAHTRLISLIDSEIDRQMAGVQGVEIIKLADAICPVEPPCALDENGRLLYWHKTHLNRRGSERLEPFWVELLSSELHLGN